MRTVRTVAITMATIVVAPIVFLAGLNVADALDRWRVRRYLYRTGPR